MPEMVLHRNTGKAHAHTDTIVHPSEVSPFTSALATAPLKQIAGLIQKLSYRDMNRLADILGSHIRGDHGGPDVIARSLLEAADAIFQGSASQ